MTLKKNKQDTSKPSDPSLVEFKCPSCGHIYRDLIYPSRGSAWTAEARDSSAFQEIVNDHIATRAAEEAADRAVVDAARARLAAPARKGGKRRARRTRNRAIVPRKCDDGVAHDWRFMAIGKWCPRCKAWDIGASPRGAPSKPRRKR